MNKLMQLILLSCKKASFFVEKEQDNSLSFIEKLQLNIHMGICDKCSAYQKQSIFINNAIKKNKSSVLLQKQLSNDSKEKMRSTIDSQLKSN